MLLKRSLLILILLTFISCSNNETHQNIQRAKNAKYSNPPKLIFNENIDELQKQIIEGTSLIMVAWNQFKFSDQTMKWAAHTSIKEFGIPSENGFRNNIYCYIFGKEQNYVNELRIVMNMKNKKGKTEAIETFLNWTNRIWLKLEISTPQELLTSLNELNEYYFEDDISYIYLYKESHIEPNNNIHPNKKLDKDITYTRWILSIKSK